MKKSVLFLAFTVLASTAFAQFNMRLTYGTFDSKQVTFGYDICKWTPFVAFDAFTLAVKLDEGDVTKLNASAFAPTLGVRYYFLNSGDLKGYGSLSAQKVFVSGKYKMEIENEGSQTIKLSDVLDTKNILQGQLAFGAEYFFNDKLSLVAEYGFRYIYSQFKTTADFGDGTYTIQPGATFARLGLGFHF